MALVIGETDKTETARIRSVSPLLSLTQMVDSLHPLLMLRSQQVGHLAGTLLLCGNVREWQSHQRNFQQTGNISVLHE